MRSSVQRSSMRSSWGGPHRDSFRRSTPSTSCTTPFWAWTAQNQPFTELRWAIPSKNISIHMKTYKITWWDPPEMWKHLKSGLNLSPSGTHMMDGLDFQKTSLKVSKNGFECFNGRWPLSASGRGVAHKSRGLG